MKLKRYKLKRDLPTFKAGGEFIICCGNLIEVKPGGTLGVCAYSASTIKKFPNILTDWFEEIKPAEPLIKDEKIRKAIRAWAEANNIKAVYYSPEEDGFYVKNFDDEIVASIYFGDKPMEEDGYGEHYTIDELCGEDEDA